MSERHFYDSAIFWLGLAAVTGTIGGVFVAVGLGQVGSTKGADYFTSIWFDGGLLLIGLAIASTIWGLALFLAHGYIASHGTGAATAQKEAAEKTTAPNRAHDAMSPEDAITAELMRLASERLADIPLRRSEILAIVHVLREAIDNVDDLPFPYGNDVQDVAFTGERRGNDQVWHIRLTTAQAYGQGILRSDGTIGTLTDLYKRLKELRREVHRRYHPPSAPATRSSPVTPPRSPTTIAHPWGLGEKPPGDVKVDILEHGWNRNPQGTMILRAEVRIHNTNEGAVRTIQQHWLRCPGYPLVNRGKVSLQRPGSSQIVGPVQPGETLEGSIYVELPNAGATGPELYELEFEDDLGRLTTATKPA